MNNEQIDVSLSPSERVQMAKEHQKTILVALEQMSEEALRATLEREDSVVQEYLLDAAIEHQSFGVVRALVAMEQSQDPDQYENTLRLVVNSAALVAESSPLIDEFLPLLNQVHANTVLQTAANIGNLQGVQAALNAGADPMADGSKALRVAVMEGASDVVALLAPRSDCNQDEGGLVGWCAQNGDAKTLEQLLPFVDQSFFNYTLAVAASCGHDDVVDLLYPHSNVERVINHWEQQPEDKRPSLGHLLKRWRADQSKADLQANVDEASAPTSGKKILL